jgi:hypothetical protein
MSHPITALDAECSLTIQPHEWAALRLEMNVPDDVDLFPFEFAPLSARRGFRRQLSAFRGLLLLSSYPETSDRPWVAFGVEHEDGLQVSGVHIDVPPGERVTRIECQLWLWRVYANDGSGFGDLRWVPPGRFQMVLMPTTWATPQQVKALFTATKIVHGLARGTGRPTGSGKTFETREKFQRELKEAITLVKKQHTLSKVAVAKQLGVSRSQLYRSMEEYPGVWEELGGR